MITFSGVVSAQELTGELVSIQVTNPAGFRVVFVAQTDPDGVYSVQPALVPGTGYQAQASIPQDGLYKAATSEVVTFDVELADRTITLNMS